MRIPTLLPSLAACAAALACSAFCTAVAAATAATRHTGEHGAFQAVQVSGNLEHPWGLAFLPDGRMLVTERPGRLRLITVDGSVGEPIRGLPEVDARSQGGLLDVALSPGFANDRRVYLSYAESGKDGSGTAVGHGRLSDDGATLTDFTVIFRQQPKLSRGQHFGSRLVFDDEGYLFVTLGENNQRPTAQDLDKLQGKVVRLRADGSIPDDNPFIGQTNAQAAIWSYGHRNPQGAALHPQTRQLWVHEHGPRGGDEINLPQPGKNYGWPLATHGINYSMLPIPEAKGETAPGTEPPHYVWEKSPAISGMAFYSGAAFPAWQGNLFIGALKDQALLRLELDNQGRVTHEERLLTDMRARIRDVRLGPDGLLYLLTDTADGALLRLEPAPTVR